MSLGLTPSDSRMLLEYPDLDYFVDELIRIRFNESITDQLKLAEAVRMGHLGTMGEQGSKAYNNWLSGKKRDLKKREEVKKETAFSLLKKSRKKKTLLSKIKGM